MRGFLLAVQAGPTSATPFLVAKEYLTPDAARTWRPMAGAIILDGVPHLETTGGDEATPNLVQVTAVARAVAEVTADGEYREFDSPATVNLHFTLQRLDGNWRIAALEDGVMLPAQVLAATYQPTRLYRPSADGRFWVPDVRWFPGATWRTNAVHALFAGAPAWLADAVLPAAPENVALQLEDIEEDSGEYVVRVQGYLRDASAETRALLRAQIAATLHGDPGNQQVILVDALGPIPIPELELPTAARTVGSARVLTDGQLLLVRGRELIVSPPNYVIPEQPTALAIGHDYGQTVVWRIGTTEIAAAAWDEDGEPILTSLFTGEQVIAPSVDNYGYIWTGDSLGGLTTRTLAGDAHDVSAAWLSGLNVEQIRVSPEGARLAVLTRGEDGSHLEVAGVIRDEFGKPIGLADPMRVGVSLFNVTAIAWHNDATLAVVGTAAGVRGVYLVGVGGLDAVGGLPRLIPGLDNPVWLTAAVGSGNILGLDADGQLHLREAMSLWPLVGSNQAVELVAYPG